LSTQDERLLQQSTTEALRFCVRRVAHGRLQAVWQAWRRAVLGLRHEDMSCRMLESEEELAASERHVIEAQATVKAMKAEVCRCSLSLCVCFPGVSLLLVRTLLLEPYMVPHP
jgi:hypothetical protein